MLLTFTCVFNFRRFCFSRLTNAFNMSEKNAQTLKVFSGVPNKVYWAKKHPNLPQLM